MEKEWWGDGDSVGVKEISSVVKRSGAANGDWKSGMLEER